MRTSQDAREDVHPGLPDWAAFGPGQSIPCMMLKRLGCSSSRVLLGDTKGTYTNAALIPLAVEYCSGDILF